MRTPRDVRRRPGREGGALPIHAVAESGAVFRAWEMDVDAWDALKRSHRDLGLAAPCCGATVIPVRSSRGWQFFRHRADSGCSVVETPEHIVCKTLVARAASRIGFDVRTEARAADGAWTADVLVRHPDWPAGTAVVVEIQLSRIPLTEIEERQDRYAAAGIRGAWLVGHHLPGVRAERSLPLFRLVPRLGHVIAPIVLCRTADGARRRVGLGAFTAALLTGRVRFDGPPDGASVPVVVSIPSACWRCCRDVDLAVGVVNVHNDVFATRGFLRADELHKVPALMADYRRGLGALCTAADALTVLRPPPPGKEAAGLRAHCPWCDAPISLRRLPPDATDPARWNRCWTFAGKPWEPGGGKPAGWVFGDSPDR